MDRKLSELVDRLENLETRSNEKNPLGHYKIPNEILQSDLPMRHILILLFLSLKDDITMGELGEKVSMSLATLTRAIDHLVKESLVLRKNDKNDRRIVRVTLATKAKLIMKRFQSERRELMASLIQGLKPGEREKFVGMVERLFGILGGFVRKGAQ